MLDPEACCCLLSFHECLSKVEGYVQQDEMCSGTFKLLLSELSCWLLTIDLLVD